MIEIRTPAKINLVLDVLGRRADGYHEVRSLMIKVGLYDRMIIERDDPGVTTLTCNVCEVPTDMSNLVCRAAACLRQEMGQTPGCRIHLEKAIPVGGGMGGGSGNAAGAFRALNQLWGAGLTDGRLAEMGSTLGSDVPFFFTVDGAIVSGRGDCVRPVRLAFAGWVVLVIGGVHVSTAQVYAQCTPRSPESFRDNLSELVEARSADALRGGLRNGLERGVFAVSAPVRALFERVQQACGRPMRISGAGSVLFDVFDTEAMAGEFAQRLRLHGITEEIRVVRAPISD